MRALRRLDREPRAVDAMMRAVEAERLALAVGGAEKFDELDVFYTTLKSGTSVADFFERYNHRPYPVKAGSAPCGCSPLTNSL